MNLREETGGYDLVAIENSEPRSIKFAIKEKASASWSVAWLSIADGDPAVIETFTVVVIPPGNTASDIRTEVAAETPARIVDGIEKALNTWYVYPELAKRMEQAVRGHLEDNKTTPWWTNPDLPGKKLATQPVYVLTSARTFSGGEAFPYELQSAKRATIVGEVTGGGTHPSRPVPLDDHFTMNVPFAREMYGQRPDGGRIAGLTTSPLGYIANEQCTHRLA
ncbi:MAG: S41 family peptidase [Kofleriaceae bacterium]